MAIFLYEMCEGILGSSYPVPDRMLKMSEIIVGQYLRREMIGKHPFTGEFEVFAVEGGTAAMRYIFNTVREKHLIKPGDTIALGAPIFTPYIEIPRPESDYRKIGRAVRTLLAEYIDRYNVATGKKLDRNKVS